MKDMKIKMFNENTKHLDKFKRGEVNEKLTK